jgi:NAD(P)-dependent dehydrogenase (short-subunit alcohol dehydrogenase family)
MTAELSVLADRAVPGLAGKVAIVTGAASGIGAATAAVFTACGARVVIADLDADRAAHTAHMLSGNGAAIGVGADVSDEHAVQRMIATAIEQFGAVDVLVNNAAHRHKADFLEMTVADWDRMFAVCTRGTFLCMRAAIRQMRRLGGGGAIVNVSSVSAAHPTIMGNAHYDAAKAGVDALTRYAAMEFGADGIRVNAVLPGGTDTEGARAIRSTATPRGPMAMPDRVPLGGRSHPSDIAALIAFLASPAASRITGQSIAVDGGYLVA